MKNDETRHWIRDIIYDGNIKHDSNGAIHIFDDDNIIWHKCADAKSERYEIRLWTLERGGKHLTHTDIDFLREEISQEPSLLVKEWDPP